MRRFDTAAIHALVSLSCTVSRAATTWCASVGLPYLLHIFTSQHRNSAHSASRHFHLEATKLLTRDWVGVIQQLEHGVLCVYTERERESDWRWGRRIGACSESLFITCRISNLPPLNSKRRKRVGKLTGWRLKFDSTFYRAEYRSTFSGSDSLTLLRRFLVFPTNIFFFALRRAINKKRERERSVTRY